MEIVGVCTLAMHIADFHDIDDVPRAESSGSCSH